MQISVTGRRVEVTDEIRGYVHEKADKLAKFYDRIHEIEVVLDLESGELTAEMIVRADRKRTFVASESGPEFSVLIDHIAEKLERQLKKLKEKRRSHKGGVAADGSSADERA